MGVRPEVAAALERWTYDAADERLVRIDVLDFARHHGLVEGEAIDGFVHAAKVGLFEMSWNLICPGCGGVLEAGNDLRCVKRERYACSMCVESFEPSLDEIVEVTFTVSPAVRRIPAHDPDRLPHWDYFRQLYFGSALVLPEGAAWDAFTEQIVVLAEEVPARGRIIFSLEAPAEFLILFDPMTHGTTLIDVKGEPTRARSELRVALTADGATPEHVELRPGPLRLIVENGTDRRTLPTLMRANDALHGFLAHRRPYLTAKRLLNNQTFRDVYRTDTLDIDQRLKITSLTVLFTDLKGSTELYEHVGDLVAYDLVRNHFGVLGGVVRAHDGAVVKTIGDSVMATFPTPESGLAAAIEMREAMDRIPRGAGDRDLPIKIGLHEGPCVAVMSNERLDYFGQTVNVAARVQRLAGPRGIVTTDRVASSPGAARLIGDRGLRLSPREERLRGVHAPLTVYEISPGGAQTVRE